jgi:acetyl-CoA carboxylase carboxyltransferase component
VMGAEAAVNAVYYNRIQAIADEAERAEFVQTKRDEYDEDINILRLASELIVDAIVEPEDLREELIKRFAAYGSKDRSFSRRRHGVTPV